MKSQSLITIMSDLTLPQVVNRLDRLEQIVASQATLLDTVILAIDKTNQTIANIPELEERNRRRHQQHDLELDDQDERTERLEKILLDSETRHQAQEAQLAELKESRADIKSMLDILLSRSVGDDGA